MITIRRKSTEVYANVIFTLASQVYGQGNRRVPIFRIEYFRMLKREPQPVYEVENVPVGDFSVRWAELHADEWCVSEEHSAAHDSWMPIGECPRDGKPFLASDGTIFKVVVCPPEKRPGDYFLSPGGYWIGTPTIGLTHWKPIRDTLPVVDTQKVQRAKGAQVKAMGRIRSRKD